MGLSKLRNFTVKGSSATTDILNITSASGSIGAETFTGFETINQTIAPGSSSILSITATPSAGGNVVFNLIDNNAGDPFAVVDMTNLGTAVR